MQKIFHSEHFVLFWNKQGYHMMILWGYRVKKLAFPKNYISWCKCVWVLQTQDELREEISCHSVLDTESIKGIIPLWSRVLGMTTKIRPLRSRDTSSITYKLRTLHFSVAPSRVLGTESIQILIPKRFFWHHICILFILYSSFSFSLFTEKILQQIAGVRGLILELCCVHILVMFYKKKISEKK